MVRRLPDPAYRAIGRVLTHPRFHPLHRRLYRSTGGWGIPGQGLGVDMLLLHTTGRSSGRSRTVPLAAVPEAARYATYRAATTRVVPLMVLHRAAEEAWP